MPKVSYTATSVKCDRCGSTDDSSIMAGRSEWGETLVKYSGHTGGRTYAGDAGGLSHKGDAWLCLRCTREFLGFMGGKAVPAIAKTEEAK